MAFDGITTKSIVKELNILIGSKINKIHEPDKNTIVLDLYSQNKNYNLNICIDAHNYRINLTTQSKPNPPVAPNFCMLLRKHLIGGRITNISMLGLERIVTIEIETLNEFNELEIKSLIVELMGKHSNIILITAQNKIIDSMRHINTTNSYREILPSRIYTLPTSDKLNFMSINNVEDFYLKFLDTNFEELAKLLSNAFIGFSLSFVTSVINKCNITSTSKEDLCKIYYYIFDILNTTKPLNIEPIYKNEKLYDYVLVIDSCNKISNLNSFIDRFYFERETIEKFNNYKNNLSKIVLDISNKYNARLLTINAKLKECKEMDKYKLYGELITANLYHLPNNHSSSIELLNYYDNNNLISIPLDIKYSPNINAKKYFKKYSKLKNAFQIVSEQKSETEKELNYIESIIYELENTSSLSEAQEIFDEISENLIFKEKLKIKNKTLKKKHQQTFSPLEYKFDNFKVYVGKNNRENDWLTFTFANKKDLWFHTKDIPGSHVILKATTAIDDNILVKCAQIAAKHSRAKNSSNVPVDYCLVQFVKKPHGSKPGMVIFSNNKTLNITP